MSDLLFLITKNATVTLYPQESSPAWFKKCCLLFYNYRVFAKVPIKEWKHAAFPKQFVCFLLYEREPKVHIIINNIKY